MPKKLLNFAALGVAASMGFFLSGCALLGLRGQDKTIRESGIVGTRVTNPPSAAPVYVLALGQGGKVVGSERLGADAASAFLLPLGKTYDVLAFADTNRNRRLDAGEPAGLLTGIAPVGLGDPNLQSRVHQIQLGAVSAAIPVGVVVPAADGAAVSVGVGEVASIHEARFAASIGEEGLWKPASSLEAGNLGLYFTEPYDPSRIPVVFVHGIGGSPQDFKKLIPALDRSRYQAWFFTYPSGLRLEKAAGALAILLDLSMRKHGVPRVDIVAHSMGGLVSRAAILRFNKRSGPGRVERFISISTPWGGYAAAKSGVKNLRYPVPSWIDMAPGSAFLTKLWKEKLPARHWLIFGYDTRRLPWLTLNNDHVIDVGSALFPAAQEESVRVFGINKSHDNILFSPVTAAKMNEFLGEK